MKIAHTMKVQEFLDGIHYPAIKEKLIDNAELLGADQYVIDTLRHIPEKEYESLEEVIEEVDKMM